MQSIKTLNRRELLRWTGAAALPIVLPSLGRAADAGRALRLKVAGESLIAHDARKLPYPEFQPLVDYLKAADLRFTNLETAIHAEGAASPPKLKQFDHWSGPEVLDCLREMGFDILSLSNNHSWDLGAKGIASTIDECRRRGFAFAGTGPHLKESATHALRDSPAGQVALVAMASKLNNPVGIATGTKPGVNHLELDGKGSAKTLNKADAQRNLRAIETAAAAASYTIAYHHNHYLEKNKTITPDWQRAWAKECIDAGATMYVADGPHQPHGIEMYKGRPIVYSPGNFFFHTRTKAGYYPAETWDSFIADCQFREGKLESLSIAPIALSEGEPGDKFLATRGRPRLATGDRAARILTRLQAMSKKLGTEVRIDGDRAEIRP